MPGLRGLDKWPGTVGMRVLDKFAGAAVLDKFPGAGREGGAAPLGTPRQRPIGLWKP